MSASESFLSLCLSLCDSLFLLVCLSFISLILSPHLCLSLGMSVIPDLLKGLFCLILVNLIYDLKKMAFPVEQSDQSNNGRHTNHSISIQIQAALKRQGQNEMHVLVCALMHCLLISICLCLLKMIASINLPQLVLE